MACVSTCSQFEICVKQRGLFHPDELLEKQSGPLIAIIQQSIPLYNRPVIWTSKRDISIYCMTLLAPTSNLFWRQLSGLGLKGYAVRVLSELTGRIGFVQPLHMLAARVTSNGSQYGFRAVSASYSWYNFHFSNLCNWRSVHKYCNLHSNSVIRFHYVLGLV